MRLNLSTSWIFRGWITCFLVTFYTQDAASKSLRCGEKQYLRNSRCCEKCGPGFHVFRHCNDSQQTKCMSCSSGEYQPGWTESTQCLQQKFCDSGKGFMERVDNPLAEEPCRCLPHLQCSPINCEFCDKIPTCGAGFGLDVDPASSNGRKSCVPCKKGFFSHSGGQCQQWTNCKAEGRREMQPGSAQADAECGPHVSVATPSWVIVSVLSVITILCLLILLLFCFKDRVKSLSVNLRSCVQNLKRTRIQQETLSPPEKNKHTLTPLYQSGDPRPPCEATKLIYQATHSSSDELPGTTGPTPDPGVKVSLPFTDETNSKTLMVDHFKGSGEPEEVSDDEGPVSVSCVCGNPVCQPLEVGENEDCSQAVSPATSGTCSCGGLDGEKDGAESGKQEKRDNAKAHGGGEKGDERLDKMFLSKSETGCASLVSLSPPPPLHISSVVVPSSPVPEHCPLLSQAQTTPEFKPHVTEQSALKQGHLHRMDSVSTEHSTTSLTTSVRSLMTSSSGGDLYLDKPADASSQEKGQRLFWEDSSGNKLPTGESELECSPESLHSQLADPTLTSGQVLGNHNTTFISSGQVMNFSGDVVVVYVSQTSLGADGVGQGDTFGSPVQEEASETQSGLRSRGDSISHSTSQDETLPVQEVMEERPVRK